MKTDVLAIFQFLKELSRNNNREWFTQHRAAYEAAKDSFENFVAEVIARISTFDESVKTLQPKDCTYRIYRDIRFSPDKTPYKNHFGGYINSKGKKSYHCGYYVHIEPGNCMLAGGSWGLPANMITAIRKSVYYNIDEYRAIVESSEFRRYFPVIGETFLKTAPKGFPKDFPYMQYLKCKDYTCTCPVDDSFFLEGDVLENIETAFRQLKRFGDFINDTIDEFE